MKERIQAIDVHGHFGASAGAPFPKFDKFMSGGPEEVVRRARMADTALTIVSPLAALLPRGRGGNFVGVKPGVFVTCCTDGFRPALFMLERIQPVANGTRDH